MSLKCRVLHGTLGAILRVAISGGGVYITVRGQKGSSDALFTPKIDIFKQTFLNTAYIKTLEEIFPSARESLSIQTSTSRSARNQSYLRCS